MKKQLLRKFSSCLTLGAGSLLWLAALNANAQAPASMGGKAFAIAVQDGTSPFASSGYALLLPANSGSAYTFVAISDLSSSTGTAVYTRSNADGLLAVNDSQVGSFTGDFNFTDPLDGTFSFSQSSSGASQDGNFTMFAGQAPASLSGKTLDLTITAGGGGNDSSGSSTISFTSSGFTAIDASGTNTGTYTYSIVNMSTGKILAQNGGHTTTAFFSFLDPSDGGFAVTNTRGGWESGTFTIPDTTPPTNQIVSPASGTQLTNGLVTVQDRATDNAGVSYVEYYLNGQDFGSGVSGISNSWAMNFALPAGTNTIQTVSTDTSGNNSTTNSIKLVYLNKQTNANLITFTDHWLDTAQTDNGDENFIITQDTALLNVALAVPGLHNLPDGTWSNLVLAMSLGELNFANSLAGADVLTATNAIFYDTQTDLSGNPVCDRQFTVTRSGDTLIIAVNMENPTYSYPNSIMAHEYIGLGGAIQDQQQFKLSLSDGNSLSNYANVTWTVFISGTDSTNSDGIGDELDNVQVFGTADFTAPTNQITVPTPGLLVSNANYTVTGKTGDNVGVTGVYYSLNNGAWSSAVTTNNWANWTAPVSLLAGTNTIAAYAVDMGGNVSTTNTVSFVYVVSAVLTVNTNGHGTLSPNYNGALLQIGKSYSMNATASTGFKFNGWSGSTNSTNASLTFLMNSNLTFTANFADVTIPTLAITTPKAGLNVSNAAFTATGTAKDNAGVAAVLFQLNGGLWVPATSTNGYTNWSANLNLNPGTNTLKAYALDGNNNSSITNTVSFFYVLSAVLTVNTNGHGTLSPNYNGALLAIGKSYSIKASASSGFKFTGWSGSQTTTNATLTFLMDSNLTFTASFVDSTAPTLAITAPKAGLNVSNAAFTATGTAKDNVGVTSVLFQLNGGLWVPATSTNGYTNWSANLNLSPGTNTLKAYALDGNNNSSITNTVSFFYVLTTVLTVNTNGHGTLSPNYNGALLEIGKSYTIKATASTGFKFTGWSGSTNSTNATLTLMMASNLNFTANFTDATPPTVTISSPANGSAVTNTLLTVAGKAADNVAVTNVYYRLLGSATASALTTNNWSNWTASVDLPLGTNIIQAYSVDSSGLLSVIQSVTVIRNPALTAFPITSGIDIYNPQAQIAFDGSNYLVAYQTHPNGPTNGSVDDAQFISPSGQLLGTPSTPLTNGDPPCVAFDGNNYLMASLTSSPAGNYVQGVFISPNGTNGSTGQLTQSTTVDNFGTMVYGGGVYFLMWGDGRNSGTNGGNDDIFGAMIAPDGTVAASDFEIGALGNLNEAGQGSAGFDGTNFLATWGGVNGGTAINGRLISPSGGFITDPFIIYTNNAITTGITLPCVAFDGTKYLVLFNVGVGSGSASGWHILGRFVTTAGEVLTNQFTVTTDAGPQIIPCAVSDGTHYFVTWNQGFNPFGSSTGSIKARFFDVKGSPVAPEFTLFTPASGQTALWAVPLFDGSRYVVVAGLGHEQSPGPNLKFSNGVISGMFVSP